MWSARSGQRDVYDIAFSEDGTLVASAAGNPNTSRGTVRVWTAGDGKLKCESIGRIDVVTKVAFSPDGRQVVTVGYDRTLTIWDVNPGRLSPGRKFRIPGGRVTDLSLDNANRRAITVSDDGAARVWDLSRDQEQQQYGVRYRDMRGAAFGKDSRWFLDATTVARSTRSAEYLGDLIRGGATSAAGVAASSDGRKFAVGSGRGMVGVWRLGEIPISVDLRGHTGRATAIAFSPDAETLVSGSDVDSDIRLWAIEEKKTIRTFGAEDRVTRCVRFSPDGKRILAVRRLKIRTDGAKSYELKEWALDGSPAGDWAIADHHIYSFAFSKDGRLLATGDRENGRVILWNAETRERVAEVKGHRSGVSAIAFMPDGFRMVTAGIDRAVKLWDTRTWTQVLTLDSGAEMDTLVVSPDGNTIVVVDHYAGRARIWNAQEPGPIKLGHPWRKMAMHELFPDMPRGRDSGSGSEPWNSTDPHGSYRGVTVPGQNRGEIRLPTTAPGGGAVGGSTTIPGAGAIVPGPNSSSDLPR